MERGSRVGRSSGGKGGRDGRGGPRVTEVKRKGWTARRADITCGGPPRRLVEGELEEGRGVHATPQSHREMRGLPVCRGPSAITPAGVKETLSGWLVLS